MIVLGVKAGINRNVERIGSLEGMPLTATQEFSISADLFRLEEMITRLEH